MASQMITVGTEDRDGTMMSDEIRSEVRRIVPSLTEDKYKGQCGKVAVIGGCNEYTGAPYFASFAALRVGADLAHVFCTAGAAPVIKSYSPELIVHPCMVESRDLKDADSSDDKKHAIVMQVASEVETWFKRIDCLVIGPGLGRDPLLLECARQVIVRAQSAALPLVLDADALYIVAREPELVTGYQPCVLTPNLNEFRRLALTLGISLHAPHNDRSSKLQEVAGCLHGPTIVSKGPVDAICDGRSIITCNAISSPRRCGGQGDILAGSVATFVCWALSFLEAARASQQSIVLPEINPMMLAAYGGCLVTRTASHFTYGSRLRSMVAGDIFDYLGKAMDLLFDHSPSSGQGVGGLGS